MMAASRVGGLSATQPLGENGTPIYLNVYDLLVHRYLDPMGMCAYHSGVEIGDREYAFFGGVSSETGVRYTVPREIAPPAKYRTSILMGYTRKTIRSIQLDIIQPLSQKYRANTYHRLRRNCNHFANELCEKILHKSIPGWVNRLAWWASWFEGCLPASLTGDMLSEEPEQLVHGGAPLPEDSFSPFDGTAHRAVSGGPTMKSYEDQMMSLHAHSLDTPSKSSGKVRIQIRTDKGERLQEEFDEDALFSHLYARVAERVGHKKFRLALAFPKANLPQNNVVSLREAGLDNTFVLMEPLN